AATAGRSHSVLARRGLPLGRGPGGPQADGALPGVGRGRGRHDGRTAIQREVRPGLPRWETRMTFEFATAGRIVFGRGQSQHIPTLARELGRRALVILGGSDRGRQVLTEGLNNAGVGSVVFNVSGEPSTHLVDRATGIARAEDRDLVISVGGGSVIDAGKAVAGLLANPG